ncbi:conserved hypothetical protein [Catenulispora acidiphila DSM 44928]|uniref:Uncharacterized protein n=1 Tax=Catenulispora acidiphila (strain DSM 44928 / JCM 14897 / NBRC 102108 / NRRL B-24433 / ID139908) TaxID=479433 RepID=C7QBJ9_CATAD|nr:conserved hypothetical protein [Catenulispora acidiphila DSM 44928]
MTATPAMPATPCTAADRHADPDSDRPMTATPEMAATPCTAADRHANANAAFIPARHDDPPASHLPSSDGEPA